MVNVSVFFKIDVVSYLVFKDQRSSLPNPVSRWVPINNTNLYPLCQRFFALFLFYFLSPFFIPRLCFFSQPLPSLTSKCMGFLFFVYPFNASFQWLVVRFLRSFCLLSSCLCLLLSLFSLSYDSFYWWSSPPLSFLISRKKLPLGELRYLAMSYFHYGLHSYLRR